jgi:hypothetical protein
MNLIEVAVQPASAAGRAFYSGGVFEYPGVDTHLGPQ